MAEESDQHRYWRECEESVGKAHPELDPEDDSYYELVKACFYRRVHRKGRQQDWDYRKQHRVTNKQYAKELKK